MKQNVQTAALLAVIIAVGCGVNHAIGGRLPVWLIATIVLFSFFSTITMVKLK